MEDSLSVFRNESGKKSKRGCLWFAIALIVTVLILGVAVLLFLGGTFLVNVVPLEGLSFASRHYSFKEEYVSGDYSSSNKIAVVDIRGIILKGEGAWGVFTDSEEICEQLEQIAEDDDAKAVILKLDTPGGEVTAADLIHHKVKQLREESGKIVIALMESVAASGGYYIAVATDCIIAHRLTITGSIGVIMQTLNYYELLNKVGLQSEVYKSGPMKDLLSGSRPRTEAEKIFVQGMISEVYDEFVKIVADGRPKLSVEDIKYTEIGDGRIFSGQKALEYGLVDELGFFEDAVNKAAEMAFPGESYKVIQYQKPFSLSDIFRAIISPDKNIHIELPGTKSWAGLLEQGKLYFLPATW